MVSCDRYPDAATMSGYFWPHGQSTYVEAQSWGVSSSNIDAAGEESADRISRPAIDDGGRERDAGFIL